MSLLQVVWFKRDLRLHDHRPLARAAAAGPVLALYVVEPALWRQPDRSAHHGAVLRDALADLDAQLRGLGTRLHVAVGTVIETLEAIRRAMGEFALHAHQETGCDFTYRRDREVIAWCRERGVAFDETPQFGVVRRLRERDGWAARWDRRMSEPLTPPPRTVRWASPPPAASLATVDSLDARLPSQALAEARAVGRAAAVADLDAFLRRRGQGYRSAMSSPLSAAEGCSRLSVHLALGSLSMREVWQSTQRRRDNLRGLPPERRGTWLADLKAFEGRLHWHCHFMQKLESEPALEFHNLSRALDGLRENDFDEQRFAAWCRGETGYPYVDACMRYLQATGWLNFRARAMLMSFAAYDLWLHWRRPALHLARLFLDYEPGIHYSQAQMQSGTTGINALRIYNPVKQGLDHDPEACFIARWVPALAPLPAALRHQPWRADAREQAAHGVVLGRDYPERIVDHAQAARAAQAAIRARRRAPEARAEAAAINATHGSRRRDRRR